MYTLYTQSSPYLDTDEYIPYICKHGRESDCAVCMNYSDEEEIEQSDTSSDQNISSSSSSSSSSIQESN